MTDPEAEIADRVRAERRWLTTVLREIPDETWTLGTLYPAWTVEDLAAYMIVRERRFPTPGWAFEFPIIRRLIDRGIATQRSKGRASIIALLEAGPPAIFTRGSHNLLVAWILNEALARGPAAQARPVPDARLDAYIWEGIPMLSRIALRRIRMSGVIALRTLDGRATAVAVGSLIPKPADPRDATLTVTGEPAEIVVMLNNWRSAAEVAVEDSDPALRSSFAACRLGF